MGLDWGRNSSGFHGAFACGLEAPGGIGGEIHALTQLHSKGYVFSVIRMLNARPN